MSAVRRSCRFPRPFVSPRRPSLALLKQVWVGLRPVGSADKSGRLEERWLGTEVDSRLSTAQARCWVRCRGGDSCGPTGVSTRCARPPHALRPCRVTRRPSLRSESSYGPCGPAGRGRPGRQGLHAGCATSSRRVGWGVRGHVAQWRPQTRGLFGCGGIELRPFPTHTCSGDSLLFALPKQ